MERLAFFVWGFMYGCLFGLLWATRPRRAARDQSQGEESKEKAPAETEAPSPICGND